MRKSFPSKQTLIQYGEKKWQKRKKRFKLELSLLYQSGFNGTERRRVKCTSRKDSSLLPSHDRILLRCKYTCCDHSDNVIMSDPTVGTLGVTAVRKGATCPLIVSLIATLLTGRRRATLRERCYK